MNMTPLEQPTLRGIFATEGVADNFLTAVERGSHVPIELSDRWDHWAWVEKPLEEAPHRAQNLAPSGMNTPTGCLP